MAGVARTWTQVSSSLHVGQLDCEQSESCWQARVRVDEQWACVRQVSFSAHP